MDKELQVPARGTICGQSKRHSGEESIVKAICGFRQPWPVMLETGKEDKESLPDEESYDIVIGMFHYLKWTESDDKVQSLAQQFKIQMGNDTCQSLLFTLQYSTAYA